MATTTATRQKPAPGSRKPEGKRFKVMQVRSTIGFDRKQAKIVQGLGLRRIGHTVELADHPSIRGMVQKVPHLVKVVE
jgi:large subunit ribosomal protein L30